ncbi:MAG TPA: biotin/lipoyl-containing protein, partial [Streptomyces sp.]|nr:biotin/lipoyl-containing protein [Streptomyces sp.]
MTEASVREFKMPDVGEGLTEAEILKWYVQPGDTVTDGQVVCEVETAKAAVELPIPYDGVVRELHFPEGTTVDVGTSIIAVQVGDGGPAPEAAVPAQAPAGEAEPRQEEQAEAKGSGRQPVLVGYGVSTSATRRRPRKGAQPQAAQMAGAIQSELNGHGGAPSAPAAPAAPAEAPAPVSGGARPL